MLIPISIFFHSDTKYNNDFGDAVTFDMGVAFV